MIMELNLFYLNYCQSIVSFNWKNIIISATSPYR